MEKKKIYSKAAILSAYNKLQPTSHFNKVSMEKLGVYSEASLDPVSLKIPEFVKEMLFTDKHHKYKHDYKAPKPAEDKKSEVVKKEVKQVKMAVFSFVTNYMKLNPKAASWHYTSDGKAIKGPLSAEDMDKLWKEDTLPLEQTLIHSSEISFEKSKASSFNTREVALAQFVSIGLLADPEIFGKIRLYPEEAAAAPVAPAKPAKKEAKKEGGEKKETKKTGKKKLSKEEKAKQQELMKAEGFNVVASKKGKVIQAEESGESEESDGKPDTEPVPPAPVSKAEPVRAAENQPAKKEESSESEDDFEYMPSKSQAKKGKKKKVKAPAFQPEIYASVGSVVPSVAKKETAKKDVSEKRSLESKPEQKKAEQKKEPKEEKKAPAQKSSKKKKGKKGPVDPSILGFNVEPPKPKAQEPEGWGEAAIKPAEIVPLSEIMKEEASKKGSK